MKKKKQKEQRKQGRAKSRAEGSIALPVKGTTPPLGADTWGMPDDCTALLPGAVERKAPPVQKGEALQEIYDCKSLLGQLKKDVKESDADAQALEKTIVHLRETKEGIDARKAGKLQCILSLERKLNILLKKEAMLAKLESLELESTSLYNETKLLRHRLVVLNSRAKLASLELESTSLYNETKLLRHRLALLNSSIDGKL